MKTYFFVFWLSAFCTVLLPRPVSEIAAPARGPGGQSRERPEVEVRISAIKDKIAAGNSLSIRVEIWNVGSQDLFICKHFHGLRLVYCDLDLTFQPSVEAARHVWAVDTIQDEKESVVDALTRNWTSIPPNHFYGSIIQLDPRYYPELNAPGHYRINGRFVSEGLLSTVYYNTLAKHPEEVAHLPGKSWKGEVETNSIRVDVRPHK
jgi:hypothetical protein